MLDGIARNGVGRRSENLKTGSVIMKLAKVNSYIFNVRRISDNRMNCVTSTYYRTVGKINSILFDYEDILSIERCELNILKLTDYTLARDYDNHDVFRVGLSQKGISLIPSNDTHSRKYNIVVADDLISKRVFYTILLKHATMHNLGLNGTEYDQSITIDKESWEYLKTKLEGDTDL